MSIKIVTITNVNVNVTKERINNMNEFNFRKVDFFNLMRAINVILKSQGTIFYPQERNGVMNWLDSRIAQIKKELNEDAPNE